MTDQTIYYKATHPDGTDFRTGTIDYTAAVGGEPITLPATDNPKCCTSSVLHASTVPTETLIGGWWPCRLFEVTGEPVTEKGHKRGFFSLTVVREIDAHHALGPQGREVEALIKRAGMLTDDEIGDLDSAWHAAWRVPLDANWYRARRAAGRAASRAARSAALSAALSATWSVAGSTDSDTTDALILRDLIGQYGFTQDHYDALTRPWRTVIGRIHPDDEDMKEASDE